MYVCMYVCMQTERGSFSKAGLFWGAGLRIMIITEAADDVADDAALCFFGGKAGGEGRGGGVD